MVDGNEREPKNGPHIRDTHRPSPFDLASVSLTWATRAVSVSILPTRDGNVPGVPLLPGVGSLVAQTQPVTQAAPRW